MAHDLSNFVSSGLKHEALKYVENEIRRGQDFRFLLDEANKGIIVAGQRFSNGPGFSPELFHFCENAKEILSFLDLQFNAIQKNHQFATRIVIGTVAGDIHDIGKNIIAFLFKISGFDVIDLGFDVSPQLFLDAVRQSGAKIVGLSGHLVRSIDVMKKTIINLKKKDSSIKVMIGGSDQLNEDIQEFVGADFRGTMKSDAIDSALQWLNAQNRKDNPPKNRLT